MMSDAMAAERFLVVRGRDGRAVIEPRGHTGEPKLWLCRLGEHIVAVDDSGPESDIGMDYGYLEAVQPTDTIEAIRAKWHQHRLAVLAAKRRARRRASVLKAAS